MKRQTLLKVIFISFGFIFLLAFFCGLIGVVSFGIILLRAALCAVAAGIVAFFIYFIYDRFLAIDGILVNDKATSSDGFDAVSPNQSDSYSALYGSSDDDIQNDSANGDRQNVSSFNGSDQGGDIPSGIGDGELHLGNSSVPSSLELNSAVNAGYDEAMSDLDNIAEDFASLSSSNHSGALEDGSISTTIDSSNPLLSSQKFGDDVKLEDIGGVDSTPSDYAKAIKTMLKKGE